MNLLYTFLSQPVLITTDLEKRIVSRQSEVFLILYSFCIVGQCRESNNVCQYPFVRVYSSCKIRNLQLCLSKFIQP